MTIQNSLSFIIRVIGSLMLGFLWLKSTETMPWLGARIDIRYGAAMAIALISSLVMIEGMSIDGLVSGLLCDALLFWALMRTKAKLKANKQA